jgi:hypothetical protein
MYELASFILLTFLLGLILTSGTRPVSLEYIHRTSRPPVLTADLNGDGREDVVAVNRRKNRLYSFLKLGNSKYKRNYITHLETTPVRGSLGIASEGKPTLGFSILLPLKPAKLEVKLEDKNGDHHLDIFVSDLTGSRWFINNGKGSFREKISLRKSYGYVTIGQ